MTCISYILWREADEAGAAGGQLLSTSCQCRLTVTISSRSEGAEPRLLRHQRPLLHLCFIFPQSLLFSPTCPPFSPSTSAPSSQFSNFLLLSSLWLPTHPSVTPTFSCKFPWQHPLKALVIKDWIRFWQVAECADSRFVVKSDYIAPSVYIVILQVISCHQHGKQMWGGKLAACFIVGTLSPCWCLCVGAPAEGRVQWQQGVSVSYIPRLSLSLPLSTDSYIWQQLPTGSDQLLLLTGQSSSKESEKR